MAGKYVCDTALDAQCIFCCCLHLGYYVTDQLLSDQQMCNEQPMSTNTESTSSLFQSSNNQPVPLTSSAEFAPEIPSTSSTSMPSTPPVASSPHDDQSSADVPSTLSAVAQSPNMLAASPSGGQSTPSTEPEVQSASKRRCVHVSPEEIRPFPKAGKRKQTSTSACQRKGESRILTDTPVKLQIEQDNEAHQKKKVITKEQESCLMTTEERKMLKKDDKENIWLKR